MNTYTVNVALADLTWSYTHTDGDVVDDDRILDGARIGWDMPEGLWPQPPQPLTASLVVNVPDFSGPVSALVEGDHCSVEVIVDSDDFTHGPITLARFFGRISDLKAQPRRRRPGVALSVAAVDYTVDPAELPEWRPTSGTWTIPGMLEQLWADLELGDFPTFDTGIFELDAVNEPTEPQPVLSLINQQLGQWIGWTTDVDDPTHRHILAPNIDPATGLPDVDQPWCLDQVVKYAADNLGDPREIPSSAVQTDTITWLYAKFNGPTRVEATGDGGNPDNRQVAAYDIDDPNPRTERIAVTLEDGSDAQRVANFYLPDPSPSRWRIDTFRYLLTRATLLDDDIADGDYFPNWTASPSSELRAHCYGRPVVITDVPSHRNPLSGGVTSDVTGRLCGANVTVAGGHIALDLQLRQTGTS